MTYHIESFWLGSWWNVSTVKTPEQAVRVYRQARNYRNRQIEIATREKRTIPTNSNLNSEMRIRRSDGVIILTEKSVS